MSGFAGAAVYAVVKNTAYSEGLWQEIDAFTKQLTSTTQMEDIRHQPVMFATREAYKRCGKDPGRYRPSSEALRRRLMRGKMCIRDRYFGLCIGGRCH